MDDSRDEAERGVPAARVGGSVLGDGVAELSLAIDAAGVVYAAGVFDADGVLKADLARALVGRDVRSLLGPAMHAALLDAIAVARTGARHRALVPIVPTRASACLELSAQPLASAADTAVLLTVRTVADAAAPPAGTPGDRLSGDLEATLEQAGIGWFERDLEHDRGTCSRVLARMLGDADDRSYDSRRLLARVLPEDLQQVRAKLEDLLHERAGEAPSRLLRYRIEHPELGVRQIEIRCRTVCDQRGRRVLGLVIDVTTAHTAEARLALAMREAVLVPFEYDAVTGLVSGPDSLAAFWGFGQSCGPWPIEAFVTALHHDDRTRLAKVVSDAAGHGNPLTVEYRLRRRAGEWCWCEARCTAEYDSDRRLARICGVVLDISARKAAELVLREREERLRLSVEAARLAVWYVDLVTRRLHVDAAVAEVLGLSDYAMPLDDFLALVQPDDRAALVDLFAAAISNRQRGTLHAEYCVLPPGREPLWADARASVVYGENGQPTGIRGVSVDITARRRQEAAHADLQRRLEQAQRMEAIGLLTGGIAHDFNNIMASILGYTELARRRFAGTADRRLGEYLGEIRSAGERARDMIKRMLAFSRGEVAGGEPIALETAVRESVRLLQPILPSSIELVVVPVSSLPAVAVDGIKVQQLLLNLCVNARDAMGGKGRLQLSLAHQPHAAGECASCHHDFKGNFVSLAVTDDGPGIAPQVLARAFDPFFTTKPPGAGAGMGLAIVHGLVHDHAGHLVVDSRPGGGTTVRVLLPVADAAAGVAAGAPVKAGVAQPLHGEVLVVDDEPAVAALFAETLELGGLRAHAVNSGASALALLREAPRRWVALVTDYAMPGMDGAELVSAARTLRADLPVVVVSAYGAEGIGGLEISALLAKPVEPEVLVSTVRSCIAAALG